MKYAMLPMMIALWMVGGCQSDPRPNPGTAALRVMVTADPNKAAASARPSVYGANTDADYKAMAEIDYAHLHDIVVWIENGTGTSVNHELPKPARVDIGGIGASTGLSGAVSVGQTVVFHNAGLNPITLSSTSSGNAFNLGTIEAFQEGSYAVQSPGLIEVKDASGAIVARVYAAPVGPVYITQPGATLDFNNLAPGHYTVLAWHLQAPGSITEIELTADHVGHATVNIGSNLRPKGE